MAKDSKNTALLKLSVEKNDGDRVILSGEENITIDKKYLSPDVEIGDEIIVTFQTTKEKEETQNQTAKDILNEILKNKS